MKRAISLLVVLSLLHSPAGFANSPDTSQRIFDTGAELRMRYGCAASSVEVDARGIGTAVLVKCSRGGAGERLYFIRGSSYVQGYPVKDREHRQALSPDRFVYYDDLTSGPQRGPVKPRNEPRSAQTTKKPGNDSGESESAPSERPTPQAFAPAPGNTSTSEGNIQAWRSGIGAAAFALQDLGNDYRNLQAHFSEGKSMQDGLRDLRNDIVDNAAKAEQELQEDQETWRNQKRAESAAELAAQAAAVKDAAAKAQADLAAANEALKQAGNVPPPSDLTDRQAVVGNLTRASLAQSIAARLSPSSRRAEGQDPGGLLEGPRRAALGTDSAEERELNREGRKWEGDAYDQELTARAQARLSAARRFAKQGSGSLARALVEEVRSMRYVAQGSTLDRSVAKADERGVRNDKEPDQRSTPPDSLQAKVEGFEQKQREIGVKQALLREKIDPLPAGSGARLGAESALNVSSALSRIAGEDFYSGALAAAGISQSLAEGVLDVALGLTPGVSVAKDFAELVSGKNIVTGETLGLFERSMAAVGVLSLGLSSEVVAVTKLATRAAGILKTSEQVEAASRTAEKLIKVTEASTATRTYLQKMRAAAVQNIGRKGLIRTEREFVDAAATYGELSERMAWLSKAAHGPKEYRYVRVIPKTRQDSVTGELITNTVDDVMKWHPGLLESEARYSIGGKLGNEALYTVLMKGEQTAEEALVLAKQEGRIVGENFVFKEARTTYTKVLDLNDPAVLGALKISPEDLVKTLSNESNHYHLTQMLGDLAAEHGYDAILAPTRFKEEAARGLGNLIHLRKPSF